MDIASAAAAYVQRGWKVIQLHDVTAGACSCQLGQYCDSAGKHPIASAWQLNYLSTAPEVYEAWARRPHAGVGVITGPASGVWVLDIDPGHGGADSLATLETEHGPMPKTYTVRTGSGGTHLYFALTNVDFDLTNSTGGRGRFPAGLDVRGRGGFVVAPPSVSGRGAYVAMADPDLPHLVGPVAEAPIWAVERQRPKPYVRPEITPGADMHDGHAYALAAVRGVLEEMASAQPGTRNETAFRVGCRLYELAIAPWARLDFQQIEQGFLEACAQANVDGNFLDGEAWSVWLRVQRRMLEPAQPPKRDPNMGTRVAWVDRIPWPASGAGGASGFGDAGQAPALTIEESYEADVLAEAYRLRVREDAKDRVVAQRFERTWREPESYGPLRDELKLPVEETRWRVGALLPAGGNAVVVAPRKAGKTTLVGALIKALVDGDLFLGRFVVTVPDGGIALFNYENTPTQQRQWLREVDALGDDRVHVMHLRGRSMNLSVPSVRKYVTGWLREREIRVWILDPYVRAGQGIILNENDSGQANVITGILDEIKTDSGVEEIIMPAHSSSKVEFEPGMETARGAGRLEDWADALWYLTVVEKERFLRAIGRDVDLDETQLHFQPQTRSLSISASGKGRREVAVERDAARVAQAIREWTGAEPPSQNDIQGACDLGSSRRVVAAVKWLVARQLIWVEDGPRRSKYHHHGPPPPTPE